MGKGATGPLLSLNKCKQKQQHNYYPNLQFSHQVNVELGWVVGTLYPRLLLEIPARPTPQSKGPLLATGWETFGNPSSIWFLGWSCFLLTVKAGLNVQWEITAWV